jgi:hypothetical protein
MNHPVYVNKNEILYIGKRITSTAGPIWHFFLNVCNSPNAVFMERKIVKVARKIGKFVKN